MLELLSPPFGAILFLPNLMRLRWQSIQAQVELYLTALPALNTGFYTTIELVERCKTSGPAILVARTVQLRDMDLADAC